MAKVALAATPRAKAKAQKKVKAAPPPRELTVSLLRHAKSDWDDAALADFDRPLSKRGLKAAPRMAAALAQLEFAPDIVLCSTAVRADQTLGLIRPQLPDGVLIEPDRELYLASPAKLLSRLQAIDGAFSHALVIGHNPGLHALALDLVRDGERAEITELARKLPTAGLVVISFAVSEWSELRPATGRLRLFLTPAMLRTKAEAARSEDADPDR
jgi:phosphohistidine phosphatase